LPTDNWGTALRDVLTDAEVRLGAGALNPKLRAFLESDGKPYERPYDDLIERIGEPITANRLETWKKLFEEVGLISVTQGKIHVSKFGAIVNDAFQAAYGFAERQNRLIGDGAVRVLGRYQLLNPTTENRGYPRSCDIFPYRAIWGAMLSLGSLHWEELHRVLLRTMRSEDLQAAIEKIRTARSDPDYHPQIPTSAETHLGPAIYADPEQAARRMTPWFSAAGFGGLLIDREPTKGQRRLTPLGAKLVPEELERPVAWRDLGKDRAAWFSYLDEAVADLLETNAQSPGPSFNMESEIGDDDLIYQEVLRLLNEDQASGILFVGPPGTGKSWYARQIAIKLVNGRRAALREVQFHPAYQYEDFVEGYVPEPGGGFVLADKHVLEMAATALQTSEPVVLLIDELTRTDPSRVMGEVLTYMDRSLRGIPFRLPSGRAATIPDNLIFLATANLDDRSVDELDAAMERRWSKISLVPDVKKVSEFLIENNVEPTMVTPICSFFNDIQRYIPVGHALFRTIASRDSMDRLWKRQIAFMLEKRFRYEPDQRTAAEALWLDCREALQAPPKAAK
jgi:hypothetical protein